MLTDKDLIQKLHLLRDIEPNKEWAFLARNRMEAMLNASKGGRYTGFPLIFAYKHFAFAVSGVMAIVVVFAIFGFVLHKDNVEVVVERGLQWRELPVVKSFQERTEFVQKNNARPNINAAIVSSDLTDQEFREILFKELELRLLELQAKVGTISSLEDAESAKKLLDQAKEALDEGDLVEAFDILVALERFLSD